MKILAIDTSSKICSVAIWEDGKKIIELHSNDEKTHSVKLMPMVDEAFKTTSLSLDDIDLLSGCVGPGSFTGVRIGIATIKAFSDAKNIPVVGVSSLESLAYNLIYNNLDNSLICSIIDAKNNNAYCGMFEKVDEKINSISDLMADEVINIIDKVNNILESNSKYKQIIFVGDGSDIYKEILENNIKCKNIVFADEEKNIANSISVAIAGFNKYLNGMYGNSNSIIPLYLRKSQAERALEEKK